LKATLVSEVIKWLLEGEPFVQYRTRIDLLGQAENEPEVQRIRKEMINSPKIQQTLYELSNWQKTVLTNHKNASHPIHGFTFIADIGLKKDDVNMSKIVGEVFEHTSDNGPFQVLVNMPKHFGGSGKDEWAWSLCDTPLVPYSLAKLGLNRDEQVQKAVKHLAGLIQENGWRCAVSKELGNFRGPGRKGDPCPYATLVMLKMLTQFDQWKRSEEVKVGAECLLDLWKRSLEVHPYLFYMGTDFRKLKAPFVWYDILHVVDVLSQFDWLRNDSRLNEMVQIIRAKADKDGRYTPESEWRAWKGWEFGQKKQPSRWLTFVTVRALSRFN
jgi:hypothetical protein